MATKQITIKAKADQAFDRSYQGNEKIVRLKISSFGNNTANDVLEIYPLPKEYALTAIYFESDSALSGSYDLVAVSGAKGTETDRTVQHTYQAGITGTKSEWYMGANAADDLYVAGQDTMLALLCKTTADDSADTGSIVLRYFAAEYFES